MDEAVQSVPSPTSAAPEHLNKENAVSFDAAIVKEQGVTFAVIAVKRHVVDSPHERNEAADVFQFQFPGMPVVLMSQDGRGRPTYWGRQDIVRFLARVPVAALPWRRFS
jgi:hypothetical protein